MCKAQGNWMICGLQFETFTVNFMSCGMYIFALWNCPECKTVSVVNWISCVILTYMPIDNFVVFLLETLVTNRITSISMLKTKTLKQVISVMLFFINIILNSHKIDA